MKDEAYSSLPIFSLYATRSTNLLVKGQSPHPILRQPSLKGFLCEQFTSVLDGTDTQNFILSVYLFYR